MTKYIGAMVGAAIVMIAGSAQAALLHNQNVTPDIIFGSGNTNGFFTVDTANGVELGLRAKIPFDGTINSGGDGTYSYSLAALLAAHPSQRWNFDWTVNTDPGAAVSTGEDIDDYTYRLGIDIDPGVATNFLVFDPITPTVPVPFFDHSIGTNATANGAGVEAVDGPTYAALIAANNVLQQSWRHAFFPIPYDPTIDGTYDIFLEAFDNTEIATGAVASTRIQVIIGNGATPVPEPASMTLFGLGLLGLGIARRRRRNLAKV